MGLSNGLVQSLSLLGRQSLLETLRSYHHLGRLQHLFFGVVVSARRYKGADRAPHVEDHVSLQVDSALFELVKPLLLKQLPHLLFRDVLAFPQQSSLILVQENGFLIYMASVTQFGLRLSKSRV